MLIEKRKVGESLRFNRKVQTCVTRIDGKQVTFKTTLACGKHEIQQGMLGEFVTLAHKIKLRISEISNDATDLVIEEPKDMVVCRL